MHAIHPDKIIIAHGNKQQSAQDDHLQFIELENAWEEYHSSVRIVQRRNGESSSSNKQSPEDDIWKEDDNSTMFGVGCSFADSPTERDLRNKIMDEACRGWFTSGSISYAERCDGDKKQKGVLDYDGNMSILQNTTDTNSKESNAQFLKN